MAGGEGTDASVGAAAAGGAAGEGGGEQEDDNVDVVVSELPRPQAAACEGHSIQNIFRDPAVFSYCTRAAE